MGTGYHAVAHAGLRAGDTVAVLGLGPVGLCAVQAARAAGLPRCSRSTRSLRRLSLAETFGATPIHLTEEEPKRVVRAATDGRASTSWSTRSAIPAARARHQPGARRRHGLGNRRLRGQGRGAARARLAEGPDARPGLANVIAHVDRVLAMMSAGLLDPAPLVTHHMSLDEAPEAYALYDRREALKIVLRP